MLVTASAGYGKSTLLQQWSDRTAQAAAVVGARSEDDAGRLLAAVAEALVPILPEAEHLASVARRAEADWACDTLPALMALASRHALALAIDDTHLLRSPSSRELLFEMARSWPAPSVLILAGRERPPVPLVRDRIAAPVIALGEPELDFDDDEIDALVADAELGLSRSELIERTGGWPAGIRLAALVRDADLGRGDITVERYLSAHVLAAFTPHELDYLGYVAALAPASVAQIDLVLRRNDTAAVLTALERRGLPMMTVPADGSAPVVVHALLAQVLTARLERRHPGSLCELVEVAVDLARRANDLSYAFVLLERLGRRDALRTFVYTSTFPMISQGRTAELRAWLDRFTSVELVEDPFLVFAHANVLRPRDEDRVRSLFARHAEDRTTILPDGSTPAVAVGRMLTAFGLQAADPHDEGLLGGWRQTSGVTRAWDLYADDRLDQAEAVLRSLRDSAPKYPLTDAVGLAKLAIIALETGRASEAEALAADAARIMDAGHMEETALGFIVDAVSLKLARRAGDLDEAEHRATAARRKMAKVGDGTMLERATTLIEVAGLHLELGQRASSVRALADEAAAIVARWERTSRLDRQLAQLDDLLGRAAEEPTAEAGTSELITSAELRVLRYLPSHLTLSRIANELYVSHSTVKTQCQSIYRKLQVGSRAEAVNAATALGLLA
ncbi:MAG: LuxR C-terminal-related transcriptional regulator [Acidimicrobiales bacterium]